MTLHRCRGMLELQIISVFERVKGVVDMFWFRRRYCPVPAPFRWLLLLFGVKYVAKSRLSDEERDEYREKARRFRTKFREALAVWDEDSEENKASD